MRAARCPIATGAPPADRAKTGLTLAREVLAKPARTGINATRKAELMGVIAVAELIADAPLAVAYAYFSDFSTWDQWMPQDFLPLAGPARALRVGDRLKVGTGPKSRMVLNLEVIRVRPNKELCWRAGVPGLLTGEHSFFFSDEGGKTRLRSEEPFSGLLSVGPLARVIERAGTRVGKSTLESFASYAARRWQPQPSAAAAAALARG